jgi:aldehyde dehydrogenase (NAD+)
VLLHAGAPNAPFGGVGESGYGHYHGRYGVDAFSHKRTVVELPTWLDKIMGSRYPPYTATPFRPDKTLVRKRLDFKRGETMAEQYTSTRSKLLSSSLTIAKAGILAAIAVWAYRFRLYAGGSSLQL